MSLDGHFLGRLEAPDSPGLTDLQEQALSAVTDAFDESGTTVDQDTLAKSTFTYYHDWTEERPRYGFILQNPGPLQPRHEGKDLLDATAPLEYVQVYQRYAREWLIDRNAHFAGRFFPLLDDLCLVDVADWTDYLRDRFFEDFYMTDLVKYRVRTGDISDQHRTESYEEQLADELGAIDLDLVFAFSSRLWKTLHEEVVLEPISTAAPDSESVSACHGHLYRGGPPLDCHVIPLSHFSRQIYGHYLRDSYFDYLEDGLTDHLQTG